MRIVSREMLKSDLVPLSPKALHKCRQLKTQTEHFDSLDLSIMKRFYRHASFTNNTLNVSIYKYPILNDRNGMFSCGTYGKYL